MKLPLILLAIFGYSFSVSADDVIYEESEVPSYSLPDPLIFEDGTPVKTKGDWSRRREEILSQFENKVYGRTVLARPTEMTFTSRKRIPDFLEGRASLEEIRIDFDGKPDGPFLDLLLIKPSTIPKGGVPTFVALNFSGNHSIHHSPEITLCESWMRMSSADEKAGFILDHQATEASRGFKASRWAVEKIISAGAALATFYYGDIDPDFDDGFQNGIHAVSGVPDSDEWGSIGSWAWGTSRVRDFLEEDEDIDQNRVAVFGHSRLGKTALWAGAQDTRFALVISNNSGCGGAALSRRRFGERVSRINTSFPHWFCRNFREFNENESALPVDQHQLIALIAPRAVYVASAEQDRWADPRGEFLSCLHASPVYELLGKPGIEGEQYPNLHQSVGEYIRYHVRAGKHDVTEYDWEQYLKAIFALKPASDAPGDKDLGPPLNDREKDSETK